MTRDERRAHLARMLDEHDRAAAELRTAIDASREAGIHTRAGMLRSEEAHDAALRAIEAMLAANRAARALYAEDQP